MDEYSPARHTILLIRMHLSAHCVTLRGVLGFLLAWAVLLLASGISISVLGFRLAPPGSAPLDTVAVVLLAVPAAILARCANTRLPEYERTRSRERQPSQLI